MDRGDTKQLSPDEFNELIAELKNRFEKNMHRHKGLEWVKLQKRLEACQNSSQAEAQKLWSLVEMEKTGGEPDVVGFIESTGEYLFADCSAESPKGRRSVCYDGEALRSRKANKPAENAVDMAAKIGIDLLSEEQYLEFQKLGPFDTKTSSWLNTPPEIRKHGGAIFGDYRFGKAFIYHNGADSYYAARGFRGSLKI